MSEPVPRITLGHGLPPIDPDVGLLILSFDRETIEALQVGRAVDDLMCLSDSPTLVQQLQGGVAIFFSGYDTDPREVADIPELRHFMRHIHNHWPYWMHFLLPHPDQWSALLTLLLDTEPAYNAATGTPTGMRRHNKDEMASVITQMHQAMNRLHEATKMPIPVREKAFDDAIEIIGQVTGKGPAYKG